MTAAKKIKSANFIIGMGTYPHDLMVSIGESDEQLLTLLQKSLLPEHFEEVQEIFYNSRHKTTTQGRAYGFNNGGMLLRLNEYPTGAVGYGYLAHEIFHIVEHLFSHIGLKHCDKSSEAFAYQIQYITEKIYDQLK